MTERRRSCVRATLALVALRGRVRVSICAHPSHAPQHFGAVSEWSKFMTRYFGKAMYYIGLGIISWRGDAPLIICSIIILVVAACFLFASFFHPRCKGFFDKNELGPD